MYFQNFTSLLTFKDRNGHATQMLMQHKNCEFHLLSHERELWHLLLQSRSFFLHLHRFVLHLEVQLHLQNPCPPDKDCFADASLMLSVVVESISSIDSNCCLQIVIWLRLNVPCNLPYLVITVELPDSFTCNKNVGTISCCFLNEMLLSFTNSLIYMFLLQQ